MRVGAASRDAPRPRAWTGALLGVAAAGTLWRLVIVWTGWVEGQILADDAFYYFKIASNLAAGHGSTFDGAAPTNGYHPLWLWLLVPVFRASGDSLWLPVQLAVTLSALLDLGTGLLLYGILRPLTGKRGALLAGCFWFLSPFTLLLGLRGMEASLAAFLLVLLLWRLDRALRSDRGPTLREALGVGALWGLAGLARTDNLPVIGVMLCVFALLRARSAERSEFRQAARWLVTAGIVAFLVVVPWCVWNLVTFGSVVQVSGLVKLQYLAGGTFNLDWSSPGFAAKTLANLIAAPLAYAARFASLEEFATPRLTLASGGLLVGGLLLPWIVSGKRLVALSRGNPGAILLCTAVAFMVAHTVTFGMLWRSYANWYALPFLALYAFVIGGVYPVWLHGFPSARRRVAIPLVAAILFLLFLHVRFMGGIGLGPGWEERVHGPRFAALAARCPEGVRAGAFNAGSLSYIAPAYGNITVVNLDCLVNNQAYTALRQGRFAGYLGENVEVLLEPLEYGWFLFRGSELDSLEAVYRKWPDLDVWSTDPPPAP